MLSAENIHVRFGRCSILEGVSFTAHPGQLTAIVGPNGSGKTTLLRAITGDVDFDGTVILNGADTAQLPAWQLACERAVLPQASMLAFPFSVIEVVRIGQLRGASGAADQLAMQALHRVGLAHYAHHFFQELSGGEQQRVHLARVLAQVWSPVQDGKPRWLLLDEPVSSLDIGHQLEVMQIARDHALAGGGVVAVMHDLNLTAMYADAVTILSQGAVLASGTPAQVLTDHVLSAAYGCDLKVNTRPEPGATYILPHAATPTVRRAEAP